MQVRYGNQLHWELRTGGLRAHTDPHFDETSEPASESDLAEAEERYQALSDEICMPLTTEIYAAGGPASPNAACVAINAARLQGEQQAEDYARLVREAHFLYGQNMGQVNNLVDLAGQVQGLDVDRFREDLTSGQALASFQGDFEAARHTLPGSPDTKEVDGRVRYAYPAFEFRTPDSDEALIVQYEDYPGFEVYDQAIQKLDPDLTPQAASSTETLFSLYPTWTTREVAACREISEEQAASELEALAKQGKIEAESFTTGILWRAS